MKRSLGLLSALVLTASLALGSAGVADAAPAKVLTKPQLRAALLTVKDLPQGFRVDPTVAMSAGSAGPDDSTTGTGDPACVTWLNLDDPVLSDPSAPKTDRGFSRKHGTESIDAGVQSFAGLAQARKSFAALTSMIGACHHATAHDPRDGSTIGFTFRHHKLRVDGHHAFVVTLLIDFQGLPMNMVITGAQVRNNVVEVSRTALGSADRSEMRLAKNLLAAQVEKAAQHLG